ncbi:MAG: hypothetical protein AB7V50_10615, partial [Vampirovibrionia bacterium]
LNMIYNQYKQMVINVTNQQLMPMTVDNKLTLNDLEILSNQTNNVPVHVKSAIGFLLKNFSNIAIMGDKDVSSISKEDINSFSQQNPTFDIQV